MTLDELLAGVRRNEEGPYRQFIIRFGPIVYRVAASWTESEEDAADVAQDVFLGLPEALRSYKRGNLEGWLKVVTRNRALMLRRSETARRVREHQAPYPNHERSPEQRIVARRALQAALAVLREDWQAVFVLKEVEGLTHEEIARQRGISVGASRQQLLRARLELRRLIELGETEEAV